MKAKVFFSKFSTKVFASVFLTSLIIVALSCLSLSFFFQRELRRAFVDRYQTLTQSLGYTLVEVENNTNLLMKNAAQIVRLRDQSNKNLSTQDLKDIAVVTSVTHIFLIDKSGKFFRSTNEDPSLIPNLFSYCANYRSLLTGQATSEVTPIIPPSPEPKPFKFLLMPSVSRDRIIEVGMRADFIEDTMEKALAGDSGIARLSLFAPNGSSLGIFGKDKSARTTANKAEFEKSESVGSILSETDHEMVIATKVAVQDPFCCECEVSHLATGSGYYYTLVADVSKASLNSAWLHVKCVLAVVAVLGFFASLALSWYLSRRLVTKISVMTARLNETVSTNDLHMNLLPDGGDELGVLSSAFDSMAHRLRLNQDRLLEAERSTAVARMTEMMAHDVRKPFSILRMGLTMLGAAKDPESVKKLLSRLVPEIDKAVSSVDGLIADVMEVGSTSDELIQEPVTPESLIDTTLGETFRIYPKADIRVSYNLQHVRKVSVHVQKVGRVFSNVVGNAVQAMGQKGNIWFKTREHDGFVEFSLGNAGSVIPPGSLPKLFEAFFTSGKKGGTGLGLAIAKKVVMAHGGAIWCESARTPEHPEGYVEFKFTLPAAVGESGWEGKALPRHSSEVAKAILAMAADAAPERASIDQSELDLEAELLRESKFLGRSLRVLIVDDEDVYRQALSVSFARTPELTNAVVIRMAADSCQALELVQKASYDLIITDVDMGPDSLDGFDLVAKLRAEPYAAPAFISVHSNRVIAHDHRNAIESGADAFLSKPASRSQFLKLALQATRAASENVGKTAEISVKSVRKGAVTTGKAKPEILVVDDNPFILEAWGDVLSRDATVHTLTSFEAVSDRLESDPGFAARLLLAVTDMHLDGSAGDGLDVGRLLKKHRSDLQVLLSSDGVYKNDDLAGAVDRAIGKDPVGLGSLKALAAVRAWATP